MKYLLLICLLAACSIPVKINYSGTYTVKEVNQDTVTLIELKEQFIIPNDTLKPGDKIQIIHIKKVK